MMQIKSKFLMIIVLVSLTTAQDVTRPLQLSTTLKTLTKEVNITKASAATVHTTDTTQHARPTETETKATRTTTVETEKGTTIDMPAISTSTTPAATSRQDTTTTTITKSDVRSSSYMVTTTTAGTTSTSGESAGVEKKKMSIEMLIAVIGLGLASLGILVLVSVCVWYQTSKTRRMNSFLKILNDNDESMLYMVDYDDVAINHGRLQVITGAQQPLNA